MVKKLLKSQMQKQTMPTKAKGQKTSKPKKENKPSKEQKETSQIQSLTKKLEILDLCDESQTKDRSIEVSKKSKKSISKGKNIPKSKETAIKVHQDGFSLKQYKKFISTMCPLHSIKYQQSKTQKEIQQNFFINLELFKKIGFIWGADKERKSLRSEAKQKKEAEVIKTTQRITYFSQITNQMMGRLKPKHWLNDEIVNSYIQLMELDILNKLKEVQKVQNIHLIQSYFATLKATPEKIQRQIKKKNFTKESTIIIPINQSYHWFFLVISNGQVFICDSILPKKSSKKEDFDLIKKGYIMKQSVKKCLQLYEALYQVEQISMNNFHVIKGFPQQDNQNDCGMMMLCGMKNVIQKFLIRPKNESLSLFTKSLTSLDFWSFCQEDISFYRYLFVKQILEQKLQIFDYFQLTLF